MSTITVTGNLTADPELRFTTSGAAVANFTVAENHRTKQGDQWADDGSTFYRVSAWKTMGENIAESLHKGDRVTVTGQFRTREYEARDGSKGRSLDITADTVGPDLRFATATPTKRSRGSHPAPQTPQSDPWGAGDDTANAPF